MEKQSLLHWTIHWASRPAMPRSVCLGRAVFGLPNCKSCDLGVDHMGHAQVITHSLTLPSYSPIHEYTRHYYWVSSTKSLPTTASPPILFYIVPSSGGRPVDRCASRRQFANLGAGQATFALAVGVGIGIGIVTTVSIQAFCS